MERWQKPKENGRVSALFAEGSRFDFRLWQLAIIVVSSLPFSCSPALPYPYLSFLFPFPFPLPPKSCLKSYLFSLTPQVKGDSETKTVKFYLRGHRNSSLKPSETNKIPFGVDGVSQKPHFKASNGLSNGACAHYVMESKFQWKPFWLATQRDP